MFRDKFIFILLLFLAVACSKPEDSTNEQEPSQIADFEGTPLPLIRINTQGNPIVDEPKTRATLQIIQEDEVLESHRIGIEIRGSSSQMFEKKSYGLETWDENDEDVNAELGGFPEEEDWILYGPYSDKTLIRNVL
ncbi:MAG: CotH kinase family protein, partial [Flavobacteriaceae bacterium]